MEEKRRVGRPETGQMPKRFFRMADADWQQIQSAAETQGETASAYLRRIALKDAGKVLKQNLKEAS